MKQVRGFSLPDHEEHLVAFLERGPTFARGPTYQIHKFQACFPFIKDFRTAIDVGGHCGLWSRPMAAVFEKVEAFEPVMAHQECFNANMRDFAIGNVRLHTMALGAKAGNVTLHTGKGSSGDTYVVEKDGEHYAGMLPLDQYEFTDVDFIKIDCEGYEKFVIQGAEKTIRENKPCMIVEQKPLKGSQFGIADDAAITLLKSWGAEQVGLISGDYILRWR